MDKKFLPLGLAVFAPPPPPPPILVCEAQTTGGSQVLGPSWFALLPRFT